MIQITEDLVLGASFKISKTGSTLVRIFDVAGLVPGSDTLAQAAVAVDPVSNAHIPIYGEPHPIVANLFANEIDAAPINGSTTAAKVTVQYGTPSQASVAGAVQVRIGGTGGHKMTAQTPDGSLISVGYTDSGGNSLMNYLKIPILALNTLLEFTRTESASPLLLSEQFRRTVNSTAWQGGGPSTWLCRGIDAVSQGSGRYEVRYTFEYDPDTWQSVEYFVDEYTGKIPDDVSITSDSSNGVGQILPYPSRDFTQLGLPNAF